MNKNQIEKALKELNLKKDEYCIVGSSALVLRGIKKEANDLDLCMTKDALNQLKTRYNITKNITTTCNTYKITNKIETILEKKENFNMEYSHGWPLKNIQNILEFKIKRNAKKDQIDIINIKKYLENQKKQ